MATHDNATKQATSDPARLAHLRRIARSGGLATLRRYGPQHYSTIGKAGFSAAMDLGWGPWLWTGKLALSFERKYGRPASRRPQPTREELDRIKEAAAVRKQARQAHPHLGGCQWPGCDQKAQHRHHIRGVHRADANAPGMLKFYCAAHHRLAHVLQRQRKEIPQ